MWQKQIELTHPSSKLFLRGGKIQTVEGNDPCCEFDLAVNYWIIYEQDNRFLCFYFVLVEAETIFLNIWFYKINVNIKKEWQFLSLPHLISLLDIWRKHFCLHIFERSFALRCIKCLKSDAWIKSYNGHRDGKS